MAERVMASTATAVIITATIIIVAITTVIIIEVIDIAGEAKKKIKSLVFLRLTEALSLMQYLV